MAKHLGAAVVFELHAVAARQSVALQVVVQLGAVGTAVVAVAMHLVQRVGDLGQVAAIGVGVIDLASGQIGDAADVRASPGEAEHSAAQAVADADELGATVVQRQCIAVAISDGEQTGDNGAGAGRCDVGAGSGGEQVDQAVAFADAEFAVIGATRDARELHVDATGVGQRCATGNVAATVAGGGEEVFAAGQRAADHGAIRPGGRVFAHVDRTAPGLGRVNGVGVGNLRCRHCHRRPGRHLGKDGRLVPRHAGGTTHLHHGVVVGDVG